MEEHHRQLSFEERERIGLFKAMGKSLREIAGLIGKDVSTISRELRRNGTRVSGKRCYLASQAEVKAREFLNEIRRYLQRYLN